MKTPRTLAECRWTTGYQSAQPRPHNRAADWFLATVIGALLAVSLIHWWST